MAAPGGSWALAEGARWEKGAETAGQYVLYGAATGAALAVLVGRRAKPVTRLSALSLGLGSGGGSGAYQWRKLETGRTLYPPHLSRKVDSTDFWLSGATLCGARSGVAGVALASAGLVGGGMSGMVVGLAAGVGAGAGYGLLEVLDAYEAGGAAVAEAPAPLPLVVIADEEDAGDGDEAAGDSAGDDAAAAGPEVAEAAEVAEEPAAGGC